MPKIERTLPPYMQVIVHVRSQIESGELQPGELIPSDRQMAAAWGISRATAQKVISGLQAEGLVETVNGVGTRVLGAAGALHRSGRDRANAFRRTGRIYTKGEYARIVISELVESPEDVAQVLRIEPGAPAVKRVRVTYNSDDQAVSTSTSWYDGALAEAAPRLLETARFPEGSWAYLEAQTGLSAVHGQDRIGTRLATQEEADLLGLEMPAAVKVSRTILRADDGSAVEYGVSVSGPGRESVYDYDVS
jgi:DNA-binding GntR family transcriptional regulator